MMYIYRLVRVDLEGAHRARATPKIISNKIFYYNVL